MTAILFIRRNGSFGAACDGCADTGHHIEGREGLFTVWSIHDFPQPIVRDVSREIAELAIAADWRATL